ncbi:hypothetical protein MRX96_029238 [Rhipicephalus microplus]
MDKAASAAGGAGEAHTHHGHGSACETASPALWERNSEQQGDSVPLPGVRRRNHRGQEARQQGPHLRASVSTMQVAGACPKVCRLLGSDRYALQLRDGQELFQAFPGGRVHRHDVLAMVHPGFTTPGCDDSA